LDSQNGTTSEFSNPNLEVLISAEQIQYRIRELGAAIARDYVGRQTPIFVGLLDDAMLFVSDLLRSTDISVDVQFMKVDSNSSSGEVYVYKDLDIPIEGHDVLLIDVLITEGSVQAYLLANLSARGATSVKLVSLLDKFERRKRDVKIDYVGFQVPDLQLVGYGLGVAGRYRNLPYLATLTVLDDARIVRIYEQEDFSGTCAVIAPDFELISAELIEYFSTHPDDLYKLNPRKFEMLLEAVFRNQGYRTELGRGWSDGGVDLRLYQKDSIGEICTLVQAKRYKDTIPIRLEAVGFLAKLVDDEKANRGLFVTTSRFLPSVQKFSEKESRRIILANSTDVAKWCEEAVRRNRER
jgi:hypoxanthine phosphoribosyltransferase